MNWVGTYVRYKINVSANASCALPLDRRPKVPSNELAVPFTNQCTFTAWPIRSLVRCNKTETNVKRSVTLKVLSQQYLRLVLRKKDTIERMAVGSSGDEDSTTEHTSRIS